MISSERAKIKAERKAAKAKSLIPSQSQLDSAHYQIIHGDLEEVGAAIPDDSIDVIITDPPYPKEYLNCYAKLATVAARVLKPGGSCVAMCGESYLPDIYPLMGQHLTYNWTLAYLTPGGQGVQQWARKAMSFWKPLLWYTKGKYDGPWVGDVAKSPVNDNDKRFHKWGQSENGMLDIINRFSLPGQTVLDPFCGAGTTGVVCVAYGRNFIGIDINQECCNKTEERLKERICE